MTGLRSARRRVWVWDLPGRPRVLTDDVMFWRTAYLRAVDHTCTPACPSPCPRDDDDPRGWQG